MLKVSSFAEGKLIIMLRVNSLSSFIGRGTTVHVATYEPADVKNEIKLVCYIGYNKKITMAMHKKRRLMFLLHLPKTQFIWLDGHLSVLICPSLLRSSLI